VTNRVEQLSYNLKFFALNKPHDKNGPRWRVGYRLKPPEHSEYLHYLAMHLPTDLTFVMNASRKRGLEYRLDPNIAVNVQRPPKRSKPVI